MKLLNRPTDTELLDALEAHLCQPKKKRRLTFRGRHDATPCVAISRHMEEAGLRIALRGFLQHHGRLPESIWNPPLVSSEAKR